MRRFLSVQALLLAAGLTAAGCVLEPPIITQYLDNHTGQQIIVQSSYRYGESTGVNDPDRIWNVDELGIFEDYYGGSAPSCPIEDESVGKSIDILLVSASGTTYETIENAATGYDNGDLVEFGRYDSLVLPCEHTVPGTWHLWEDGTFTFEAE